MTYATTVPEVIKALKIIKNKLNKTHRRIPQSFLVDVQVIELREEHRWCGDETEDNQDCQVDGDGLAPPEWSRPRQVVPNRDDAIFNT